MNEMKFNNIEYDTEMKFFMYELHFHPAHNAIIFCLL